MLASTNILGIILLLIIVVAALVCQHELWKDE